MSAISVVTLNSSALSPKVLQNSNNNREVLVIQKTNLKAKRLRKDSNVPRVSNPTPISVARRNARERNRVKQVNNGFATLRQHIPPEIAAAFEQQTNNGRTTTNKKLSKVETLRMAVEYIRSLEEILAAAHSIKTEDSDLSSINSSTVSTNSTGSFPSPTLSTSSFVYSNSTIGHDLTKPYQYIRIPGTDNYQLINQFANEDEENIQPFMDDISSGDDVFIESPLSSINFDDSNMFSSNLSPYSENENSLSSETFLRNNTLPPIIVLQQRNQLKSINQKLISPKNELFMSTGDDPTQTDPEFMQSSALYSPDSDCPIKTELPDDVDLNLNHAGIIKTEEMVDVMDWWENGGKLYTTS